MMLYPPMADLAKKAGGRYQLVNLVARRARALSDEAEANQTPLERKSVSIALDEVYAGKLVILSKNGESVEAPAAEE